MSAKKSGESHFRSLSTAPKIGNAARVMPKGPTHLRDKATINRLKMYNSRARFTKQGEFLGGEFMSRTVDAPVKRIQPDRRWFGNTRTIGQKDLETFREQMANKIHDPYTVVLRQQKLPMALLNDPFQSAKMKLLEVETFTDTFGPKAQRKKARLPENVGDVATLRENVAQQAQGYDSTKDAHNAHNVVEAMHDGALQEVFKKGQSKRIWNELYKVIDASDVLVQVLDVRDPMGTRCKRIEDELRRPERRHKHLILVLNKCDLVPTWVTRRWIKLLSREYPTLAFHASITNPFGKGSLLQLLRQFSRLHIDKKQISIGFVGYPNVGKSSVINAIKGDNVCVAAPVPGETKVWKFITLFKRIFLIDCPGVVYPFGNTPTDCVIKGVVRMETIEDPAHFVPAILQRLRPVYINKHFGVATWRDANDFLSQLARLSGKLLKGGDPDIRTAARMVLHDWQLGRLPHFVCPPFTEGDKGGFDMNSIGAESNMPGEAESAAKRKTKKAAAEDDDSEDDDNDDSDVNNSEDDDSEDEDEEDGEVGPNGKRARPSAEAQAAWEAKKAAVAARKAAAKVARDDGLNTDSETDEDEDPDLKRLRKLKVKRARNEKKKSKIEKDIQLEVDEQELHTLAVRSSYGAVDMDERLYFKERAEAEKNGTDRADGYASSLSQYHASAQVADVSDDDDDEDTAPAARGAARAALKDAVADAIDAAVAAEGGETLPEQAARVLREEKERARAAVLARLAARGILTKTSAAGAAAAEAAKTAAGEAAAKQAKAAASKEAAAAKAKQADPTDDVTAYVASSTLFSTAGVAVPAQVKALFDLTPLAGARKNKHEHEAEKARKVTGKSILVLSDKDKAAAQATSAKIAAEKKAIEAAAAENAAAQKAPASRKRTTASK